MNHEQFQGMLDELVGQSGVGQEVLGEVLARTSLRAPAETSRVEISAGNPAARRPVDQRAIPQGTVSKAVKALKGKGLLEDGEKLLKSPDGRTLSPLRLGSLYAIAGVKVVQSGGQPRRVTTALLGLDGSRVLGTTHGAADNWDQVADLIHQHVTSLKIACDRDRTSRGLEPVQMFGVGIEVGSPVHDGEVMPHPSGGSKPPVRLAAALRHLFDADTSFNQPVPVVVENDVNALAVLAIHQIHYTDPDLVVVGVFDEGVGGGLVMDGRLRRGGNGRAMEIGHLAVGFPPGQQEQPPNLQVSGLEAASAVLPGFSARCSCGHFGHVDTLAPPRRIQGMLGDAGLDRLSAIDIRDPEFKRVQNVFARSGAALGRALAHVSNTVNPSRIIAYLPGPLAEPQPDTAAAAYLSAARQEVKRAFAAGNQPDYLTIRPLPARSADAALLGAKAAAVCVLESFIEHALRLDGCSTALRRSGTRTGSFRTRSQAQAA
jgi:predicted NBD/HSP70 family sugar kinase